MNTTEKKKQNKQEMKGKDIEWEDYWDEGKAPIGRRLIEFMRNHYFSQGVVNQLKGHRGRTVLEPGAGSCESLVLAAKNAKKVTGMDISPKSIEVAEKNFKKAKISKSKYNLVQGDIFKMPFKTSSFDIVFNAGVIEHFDSLKPVEEMIRVTKPEGRTIILVPAKYSPYSFVFHFIKAVGLLNLFPWADAKWYTKEMMRSELMKSGAKKVKIKQPWSLFGIYIIGIAKK